MIDQANRNSRARGSRSEEEEILLLSLTREGDIVFSIGTTYDAQTGLTIDGLDKITLEKRG